MSCSAAMSLFKSDELKTMHGPNPAWSLFFYKSTYPKSSTYPKEYKIKVLTTQNY